MVPRLSGQTSIPSGVLFLFPNLFCNLTESHGTTLELSSDQLTHISSGKMVFSLVSQARVRLSSSFCLRLSLHLEIFWQLPVAPKNSLTYKDCLNFPLLRIPIPRTFPWGWTDVCRLSPYTGIKGVVGCVRNYGYKGLIERRYTYIIYMQHVYLHYYNLSMYSASTEDKGFTVCILSVLYM